MGNRISGSAGVVRYTLLVLSALVLSGCLLSEQPLISPGATATPFARNARYVVFAMNRSSASLLGEGRATFNAVDEVYYYAAPGFTDATEYFRAAQVAPDLYLLEKDYSDGGAVYGMAVKNQDAILVYTNPLNDWCDMQSDRELARFNASSQGNLGVGDHSCYFKDLDGLKRAILEANRKISLSPDYVMFEVPQKGS